jgi:hypothetical protein
MNAETDVSLSVEGAVCKNLPASAVESVNREFSYLGEKGFFRFSSRTVLI